MGVWLEEIRRHVLYCRALIDQVGRGSKTTVQVRTGVKPPMPSFPPSFEFLETNAMLIM